MSKYGNDTPRTFIEQEKLAHIVHAILTAISLPEDIAAAVTDHLIASDVSGVESHGSWRILQYSNYYASGYLAPETRPELVRQKNGTVIVDGHAAIGIPAMNLAISNVTDRAKDQGIAAIAIKNAGHTGRLGAYAEYAAERNCLSIIVGGGGRKDWRLVAPYGGKKAIMSTNPYAIGMPGGDEGPVIADFATSAAAAGWVYGAKIAGATLPDNILIDKNGAPTNNPQDYFDGGAILSAGGAKGYALAVAAEMIAEAMLGPVKVECNWLIITMDCGLYNEADHYRGIAEEILQELRDCPPAAGFEQVYVPGEREARSRKRNANQPISLPTSTWEEIKSCADRLGIKTV